MRTEADVMDSMKEHFAGVSDPRVPGRTLYPLMEVLVMAFVGVLCGGDDWEGIVAIAEEHESWLRQFLTMEHGVPSHDTFGRVLSLVDPEVVSLRMIDWIKTFRETCGEEIIAIDGKALRRSGSKKQGLKMLYTVGAWATENGLILGQQIVDDKSNEITAIPQLLELLEIKGSTITIDAAGCQKNIAAQIVEKEAYYVLAVKGNQPSLDEALQRVFREALANDFAELKHECLVESETSHGRVEQRATHILQLPKDFAPKSEWADLNTMVVVIRHWKNVGDEDSQEHWDQRTFISNHQFRSKTLRRAPRSHWSIENKLHWVLDVQLREDDHQLQDRHGAANLALLRRLTVSLLQQDTQTKVGKGIKNKRLRAAANPNYVLKLLANANF
jgi:predicted transposase YbfD/YdcC